MNRHRLCSSRFVVLLWTLALTVGCSDNRVALSDIGVSTIRFNPSNAELPPGSVLSIEDSYALAEEFAREHDLPAPVMNWRLLLDDRLFFASLKRVDHVPLIGYCVSPENGNVCHMKLLVNVYHLGGDTVLLRRSTSSAEPLGRICE